MNELPGAINDRILRLPAVADRVSLSTDTIYRLARAGKFPRPFKISANASGWLESEINAYVASRAATREIIPASRS